jgi:hypothetical protein
MSRVEQDVLAAIDGLRGTGDAGTNGNGPTKKHVFVLMDESGSMGGLEEAVISGCNEFIHSFADENGAHLWLAWFDDSPGQERVRVKFPGLPAAEVEPLTAGDYIPRGMTPLNDAICTAVKTLDGAAGEHDVVFLAIITDGMENSSETSVATVKALLAAREEAGWGVVFIGANQDSASTASELGMVKPGSAFNFDADEQSMGEVMMSVSDLAHTRAEHGAGKAGLDAYDLEAERFHREAGGRADKKGPEPE